MNTKMMSGLAVLLFGDRRIPGPLSPFTPIRIDDSAAIDAAAGDSRRLVVVGSDADLAGVLTRLMRQDLLHVEVAHLPGGPRDRFTARRALSGPARRVPLIRDDSGTALVGSAVWLPAAGEATVHGEAVVDDTVLFDGDATGVRIEPLLEIPGLRATVLDGRRRRWVTGRAVQLGTTGARVIRDGVTGARDVRRSTFYRHTTGWLRVN